MFIYIMSCMGNYLLNYADDFLGVEYETRVNVAREAFLRLLEKVGTARSIKKSVAPTQVIEFIGNLVNTIDMTLGVTPQRKVEVLEELEKWRGKVTCMRRQLESLIGKLQFMSNCIGPGRLFVSRLLEEMKGMQRNKVYLVNQEMRKDVKW